MTVSRHTVTAYVGTTELDVKSASVTLDRTWSPYVAATLTMPKPNEATLNALDPRIKPRVSVFLSQDFGNSQKVSLLTSQFAGLTVAALTSAFHNQFLSQRTSVYFESWNASQIIPSTTRDLDLGVRTTTVDHNTGEVTLELTSDEGYLQDYALVDTANFTPGYTSVKTAVSDALSRIGAVLQTTALDGTVEASATSWEPGQTAWDYITPLLTATSLRLYCDERRFWYLVGDNDTVPGTLVLTDASTIVQATDGISRDARWYDAVVITYTFRDTTTGTTTVNIDAASNGTPTKVLALDYSTYYPGPGAAARVLARATGLGRVQSVQAVNDYSATPGQESRLTLPGTLENVGTVQSIVWNLPGDIMAVESSGLVEIPATAWAKVAAGIRWQDISAGISWTAYTP
jgi:hypothetical protein